MCNDMIVSAGGEILTDTAPFTFPFLNEATDYVQKELMNHGMNVFEKETILASVTPIAVIDPGVQVDISESGYFDGVNNNASPTIPVDLIMPTRLWERQTGSQELWLPMTQILDGLPAVVQTSRLGMWEWREDGLYMPGATQSEDIRLRYLSETISFSSVDDIILIRGVNSPIANRIAYKFTLSRGSPLATQFKADADAGILQICTTNARMKQRASVVRKRFGSSRQSATRTT